jgi:hypothetical protein
MRHVENIRHAVGDKIEQLDSGYRVVRYKTTDAVGLPIWESAIVDGQHRAEVLREYYSNGPHLCQPPFPVLIIEKDVDSELEVIAYFNAVNNTMPIKYTDVNLIINAYIVELERTFNVKKGAANKVIRPKATHRPFLSTEKIRDLLLKHANRLNSDSAQINAFVDRVKGWNEKKIRSADIDMISASSVKDGDMIQRAASIGFMLGVDSSLPWIVELL